MKVDVLIERDKLGRLHAYAWHRRPDGVIEKGDDILKKRVFRNLTMAKVECDAVIRKMFIMIDLERINYTFPEDFKS